SPVNAPAAAARMTSARFGRPLATDSAVRAMAKDSLGMGGKNPSIAANRYIPTYTRGEAASVRIQFSTGRQLLGRWPGDQQRPHRGSTGSLYRWPVRLEGLRICP